jgi:hypothetical protein
MGFIYVNDSEIVVYKITPKSGTFSTRQPANFART